MRESVNSMNDKHHSQDVDDDWKDGWEDGELTLQEIQAGHMKHRCTDILCCVVFLLACVAFWCVYAFGVKHGRIDRLYHGYNFTGYMCGVDSEQTRPYVFFCKKEGVMDVKHPICIQACPQNESENHSCYTKVKEVSDGNVTEISDGNATVMEVTSPQVQLTFAEYPNYPSAGKMETYCLPVDPDLEAQVHAALGSRSYIDDHIPSFSEVGRCWQLFLVPVAIGCILSTAAGCLLGNDCARCLLSCILFGFLINAIILAIIMFRRSNFSCLYEADCWIRFLHWYEDWAFMACVLLVLLILCIVCNSQSYDVFEAAYGCMHAVMELQSDKLGILVGIPAATIILEVSLTAVLWHGLLCLMSTSHPQKLTLEEYAVVSESGATWFETWYHGWVDDPMVWYYIGMWLWIRFSCMYLFLFITVYTASLWYFTPWPRASNHKKALPFGMILYACWVALRYHLGSIVLAGLVLPITYVYREGSRQAYRFTQISDSCCARTIQCCCCCCINWYLDTFVGVDKTALIGIAVRSTPFWESDGLTFHKLNRQNRIIRYLVGSANILVGLGSGFAFTTAYIVAHVLVNDVSPFNNPASSHYVDFPQFACIMSGVLSTMIVYSYLSMCDMVTDTFFYCRVSEEERIKDGLLDEDSEYAPRSLIELIELFKHEHLEWLE